VALTVSSVKATASARGSLTYGDHHLSTDDSDHLPTKTVPPNGGRPKAHRQVLTPVLATRTRTRPSQNTSTALAAYDVLCDTLVQPTAQGGLGRGRRKEDLDVDGARRRQHGCTPSGGSEGRRAQCMRGVRRHVYCLGDRSLFKGGSPHSHSKRHGQSLHRRAPGFPPYDTRAGSHMSCELTRNRRSQTAAREAGNRPTVISVPPSSP
jgi:hypothetical protein